MAAVSHPKVIVLEEPTTGLDVSTQAMVLGMVAALCPANDMAAIYISHDLAVVASIADTVSAMYAGSSSSPARRTRYPATQPTRTPGPCSTPYRPSSSSDG